MDPNHWNTYNFQYGAAQGGLPPTHPSLGLSLSHGLQGTHGAISGRSVSALPSVNYSGLGVPILETMAPLSGSLQPQQAHKSMSIGESVFDQQVRASSEQLSPSLNRYDAGSKMLRTNHLLEAARVWSGTNFPSSSSLYNQYSAILPEVAMSVSSPISVSSGLGNFASSKSSQPILQEPPPAHSSSVSRITSCQRTQHMGELIYSRNSESLNPSSLTHVGSSYSSSLIKEVHSGSQQQSALLHRQTSQTPHGYLSSHRESENLSSSAQHQLYGSYANLASVESQDFTPVHMSNDMTYEAVSPAPPVPQENNTPAHMESSSFSQFPEFSSLGPEHAQAIVDKFQENDFRSKLYPMRSQQLTHDSLSFHQVGLRQEIKTTKDVSTLEHSLQMNQPSSVFSNIQSSTNIPHSSSPHHPTHTGSLSLSSMQQLQTPPTVQAPADSTTKPKRVRNRKKKGEVAVTTSASNNNTKKNISPAEAVHRHHVSNLHMTPSSQISTLPLPHSPLIAHDSQQQQRFPTNHFTSRDVQRAQTPSIPQNYSMSEHQGYTHSPSPKVQNNPSGLMSHDFSISTGMTSEKSTYKQQQRKAKEPSTSPNLNQSNNQPLYISNIPDVQGYSDPNTLINLSGHTDSTIPGSNQRSGHISRLSSYQSVPGQHQTQHSLSNALPNINQHSPQDSISTGNKIHTSNQYIGNAGIINMQQTMSDSRQSSSSHSHSPLEPQSRVVMNQTSGGPGFESRETAVMIDGQDPSSQFQVDFAGQPFLEQLVSAQNHNFSQDVGESGEVILTTLVNPAESAPMQEEQSGEEASFRPTYHGEAVHEIHPVGPLCGGLNVDEMSFNSYDSPNGMNPASMMSQNQASYSEFAQLEVEPMTLTFMPSVAEDDEFNHFSGLDGTPMIKKEPETSNKMKKDSFQDSFLSYLKGNKQETLSSVSSAAITKKPQLPKYIPEPRRPKPNITVLTKEPILLSDTEDTAFLSSQGKDFLSTLSDNDNSSQKSESDKEGYTVQRTSELAMKITLPKGKKKGNISTLGESALLSHNKKQLKDEKVKIKKKRGKNTDSDDEYASGENIITPGQPVKREPSPPPVRTSIGRKAKDRCMEKTKKKRGKYAESGSSTEDEIFPLKTAMDSDKDYDSDKDPVWKPFEQDLKAGYDFMEKKKKTKRIRLRAPIRAPPSTSKAIVQQPAANSVPKSPAVIKTDVKSNVPNLSGSNVENTYKLGQYLIEKKDLQNYENYPIWRLEHGSMIHKYELVVQEGVVRHKAVGTYSTWMKSMFDQFQPIKVKELMMKGKGESMLVQVQEEFQPKMPTDGKLIQQYEDDPLVEPFNVYLQVFISQALEPTFLKAIMDMGESFYLDPLNEIDHLVQGKVKQIAAAAKWKPSFQDVLQKCPLMKEIDRPNLKQACQACEHSSPPTIKSVLLSGHAYDRTLLTNIPGAGNDATQEFMIGKVAAHYVRPYHSLYHFKYWLRTRCEAKVKIMKESNKSENLTGENILDKCLENRNWVLQLFDNFKKLLAFESDITR